MDRQNVRQRAQLVALAPAEKFSRGQEIGSARVVVFNLRAKEIQETIAASDAATSAGTTI